MIIPAARRKKLAAYLRNHTIAETHRKFGHAKSTLRLIKRDVLGILPQRVPWRIDDAGCYLPTPEQIAAACLEFQRQHRREDDAPTYTVPQFGVSHVGRRGRTQFEAM